MITVICCYNDKEMLEDFVCKSLARQSVECKRIFIDTRRLNFNSAASAYNSLLDNPQKYGVEVTDYLVFTHQDIDFNESDFLVRLEEFLASHPDDVVGFIGMSELRRVTTNVRRRSCDEYYGSRRVVDYEEVLSVDECCFAMSYDLWRKVRFDEWVCDHWHQYAVEFCYNARKKVTSKTYVSPLRIYHKEGLDSGGLYTDSHFLRSIWRMVRKHRDVAPTIYTPCYIVPTALIPSIVKLTRTRVKNFLNRWLGLSF